MGSPTYLSDEVIRELLEWDTLIPSIEKAMEGLSNNEVIQPPRLVMLVPSKDGKAVAMQAFSICQEALGCKIVTAFNKNYERGLPSILGTILLLDSDTGKLKVILEGIEITKWRTAAASVVATKHLHRGEKKVLAILGAGSQGRIHALAMKYYFNFTEVRIWNRTPERAKKLCEELGPWAVHCINNEDCVRGADVIVTATYSSSPLVMLPWVKDGAHVNAVGVNRGCHYSELDEKLYRDNGVSLFVDHMKTAEKELKGLTDKGVQLVAEVGHVIKNRTILSSKSKITIFQSHGMAVEDVITAKLVYNSYINKKR